MQTVVLIKKVPDPNLPESFVGVSTGGDAIELHASAQSTLNPYDLNAVEAAVALKEAHGGTVTVITADDASAEPYLRRAIAMGADAAVRVDLAAKAPKAIAAALNEGLQSLGQIDLILAGRAASDTDAGLVPYLVANAREIPALGPIVALRDVTSTGLTAGKLSDTSIDHYAVTFPAMLLVSNEINKPRTPAIKGVMASKKAKIELVSPTAANAPAEAALYAPKAARGQADSTVLKDVSDAEKAAALLAALGY